MKLLTDTSLVLLPRRDLRFSLGIIPNTAIGQKIRFVFGSSELTSKRYSEMSILKDDIERSIYSGSNYMGWDY